MISYVSLQLPTRQMGPRAFSSPLCHFVRRRRLLTALTALLITRPVSTCAASPGALEFAPYEIARLTAPGGGQLAAVATDASGNAYVVGSFLRRATFTTRTQQVDLASKGSSDAFFSRIIPLGRSDWSATLGTTGSEEFNAVGVDADGNVYTYGTLSRDVGFIAKYDSAGKRQWFEACPSTSRFTVDGRGRCYTVTGNTSLEPPQPKVVVYSSAGKQEQTVSLADRPGIVRDVAILVGKRGGGVLVGGRFVDTVVIGKTTLIPQTSEDSFLASIGPNADITWVTQTDCINGAYFLCAGLDPQDGLLALVRMPSTETLFARRTLEDPLMPIRRIEPGDTGLFGALQPCGIVRYDASGTVTRALRLGSESQFLRGICADNRGNAVLLGDWLRSDDANYGWPSLKAPSNTSKYTFIASLTEHGSPLWAQPLDYRLSTMSLSASGHLYTIGYYGSDMSRVFCIDVSRQVTPAESNPSSPTPDSTNPTPVSTPVPKSPVDPKKAWAQVILGTRDFDKFKSVEQEYKQPFDSVWEALTKSWLMTDYKPDEYDANKESGIFATQSKPFLPYGTASYVIHTAYKVFVSPVNDSSTTVTVLCLTYDETLKSQARGSNQLTLNNGYQNKDRAKSVLKAIEKQLSKK